MLREISKKATKEVANFMIIIRLNVDALILISYNLLVITFRLFRDMLLNYDPIQSELSNLNFITNKPNSRLIFLF